MGGIFSQYEKKIKFKKHRPEMTAELQTLIEDKRIDADDALHGLQILTKAFICDKSTPYDNMPYDVEHSKRICAALWNIDELSKPVESRDDHSLYRRAYLQNVEMLVNEVDETFHEDKKLDKLFTFAECFRDMSNLYMGVADGVAPYEGVTLKISDRIYHHKHSVVVLPNDPSQAVAALFFDEKPRLLFAEYDKKESAETVIKELYGTDGAYAEHYKSFLDCRRECKLNCVSRV